MLIAMRKPIAKVITVGLFALLILSFAVWGIGDIFRTGNQVSTVAAIGGIEITQSEFSRALSRDLRQLRQRFGSEFTVAQAQALGIVDQVLQQQITRATFEEQSADMGLIVSKEQIQERIRTEPAFQNALGDFERSRFFQILRSNGLSEQQFVRDLGRDINREQMVDAIGGVTAAPRTLAQTLYAYRQERRIAETITVSADSLPPPPAATDEALVQVHSDYADRFKAPEYRAASLIYLQADDLAEEFTVTEEELKEEFEARRDEFRVAERRSLEQIVFPDEAQARKALAALDGGQSLAEVSEALLARTPVDLGMVEQAELALQLPELADAAFALEQGRPSAPVESPLGWHIVQVNQIERGTEPDFAAAREELANDLTMRSAVDSMVSIANELDAELASGASLEEAAELLSLELRRVPAMDAGGKTPEEEIIEGLPPIEELVPAVFQNEPGDDVLLTETRDGNYFAARVDGVTPAAERPLDAVRVEVTELWLSLERDRLALEKAEALAEQARGSETLESLAKTAGLPYDTTDPIARADTGSLDRGLRELGAKLFELSDGEVTTAATQGGYIVAKLVEIESVDWSSNPDAVEALQEELAQSLRSDLLTGFVDSLRKEFGVTVNGQVLEATLSAL